MTSANPNSASQIAVRKRSRSDRADEVLVIRNLMSTPTGRRWVWLQLEMCQVYADGASLDPQFLAWQVGRRSYGLNLLGQVTRHTPDAYILMVNENTRITLATTDPTDEEEEDPNE